MQELSLIAPDDMHLHLRDGAVLRDVVPASAAHFARAVVMPNLRPPVTTVSQALAYRQRILAALPPSMAFEPLMSLYLTAATSVREVAEAARCPHVVGFKLYPAGATTNADQGVRDVAAVYPALEAMQAHDLVLQVHAEVADDAVDVFDRERVFIEQVLAPLVDEFPRLRVVVEHLSSREAVQFVAGAPASVGATLTAHHLLLNRNALLAGALRPHHYCLPLLKREADREALVAAAVGGDTRFFLGTDSAPHARSAKLSACGCAGIYSAPVALAVYAELFARHGALDRLEAFASRNGAAFYRLPLNARRLRLVRRPQAVADELAFGDEVVVPLGAGGEVAWQVQPDDGAPA